MTEDPLGKAWREFWESMTPLKRALWTRSLIHTFSGVTNAAVPLYHYTSPEALVSIIRTQKVWATNTAYLNDQGELTYPLALASDVINRMVEEAPDQPERDLLILLVPALDAHELFRSWYTCSFSTEGNLLSQWRAYCPGGGYSIGFDGEALTEALKKSHEYKFGPVEYDPIAQAKRIKDVILNMLNIYRELRPSFSDVANADYLREAQYTVALALSDEFVFFKAPAFAEEREWRLAKYSFDDHQDVLLRNRAGLLTPYYEIALGSPEHRLPLSDIYVSPLGETELSTHAAAIALRREGYDSERMIKAPGYRLRF